MIGVYPDLNRHGQGEWGGVVTSRVGVVVGESKPSARQLFDRSSEDVVQDYAEHVRHRCRYSLRSESKFTDGPLKTSLRLRGVGTSSTPLKSSLKFREEERSILRSRVSKRRRTRPKFTERLPTSTAEIQTRETPARSASSAWLSPRSRRRPRTVAARSRAELTFMGITFVNVRRQASLVNVRDKNIMTTNVDMTILHTNVDRLNI